MSLKEEIYPQVIPLLNLHTNIVMLCCLQYEKCKCDVLCQLLVLFVFFDKYSRYAASYVGKFVQRSFVCVCVCALSSEYRQICHNLMWIFFFQNKYVSISKRVHMLFIQWCCLVVQNRRACPEQTGVAGYLNFDFLFLFTTQQLLNQISHLFYYFILFSTNLPVESKLFSRPHIFLLRKQIYLKPT